MKTSDILNGKETGTVVEGLILEIVEEQLLHYASIIRAAIQETDQNERRRLIRSVGKEASDLGARILH